MGLQLESWNVGELESWSCGAAGAQRLAGFAAACSDRACDEPSMWLCDFMINYILLVSRQGKVRLAKWFSTMAPKTKAKIIKDVTQLVLARRTRMCNFLEYKDSKVVYRRYASLFFVCGIGPSDNELVTLEIIHRYVEVLDRYFGNVCELDLIFNFQKAYAILDELIIAGELQESSKKSVLRVVTQSDSVEEQENAEDTMARIGSRSGPMI